MLKHSLIGMLFCLSSLLAEPEFFSISSKEQSEIFFKLFGASPKTSDKLLSSGIKLPFDIVAKQRDKNYMKGFLVSADRSVFDFTILTKNSTSTVNLKPSDVRPSIAYSRILWRDIPKQQTDKISSTIKNFETKTKKKVLNVDIAGYAIQVDNIRLPQKIESVTLKGDGFVSYIFVFESVFYDSNGFSVEPKDKELPVDFERVSDFYSLNRFHPILQKFMPHYGIDLVANEGKSVYAVMDGVVSEVGYGSLIGNYVRITHQNSYETLYGHLSVVNASLSKGSRIYKKEIVGLVGHTGLTTGAHLHFGVKKGGVNINPADFYGNPTSQVAGVGFFEFAKEAKQRAITLSK